MATQKMILKDVGPHDGEYEIDFDQPYNGDEWHFIKQVSGVRMGEWESAMDAGDYDVLLAIAVLQLKREGKITDRDMHQLFSKFRSAPLGCVAFPEADDAGPPEQKQSGKPSESGQGSIGSSLSSSSPLLNGTSDDPPATTLVPIGSLGSDAGTP